MGRRRLRRSSMEQRVTIMYVIDRGVNVKTNVMSLSGLSYACFKYNLKILMDLGYVIGDNKKYCENLFLTGLGKKFLKFIDENKDMFGATFKYLTCIDYLAV